MKKFAYTLTLALLTSTIYSHNLYAKEYTIDMMECDEVNDILLCIDKETGDNVNGIAIQYYENGKIMLESVFKDGKQDGISKSYYENGQLEEESVIKDGKKNGISKFYYENGQLKAEIINKDGKKDGISKLYYGNGKLKSEATFKDDKSK